MAYIRSEKSCNVTFPITIIGYELKLLHNQHLQIDVILLCSVFFFFFLNITNVTSGFWGTLGTLHLFWLMHCTWLSTENMSFYSATSYMHFNAWKAHIHFPSTKYIIRCLFKGSHSLKQHPCIILNHLITFKYGVLMALWKEAVGIRAIVC